jgi:hypothetical protein
MFWSVPKPFLQCITFEANFWGKHFPICFILLKTNEEFDYIKAFEKFKELTKFSVQYIVTDFERD